MTALSGSMSEIFQPGAQTGSGDAHAPAPEDPTTSFDQALQRQAQEMPPPPRSSPPAKQTAPEASPKSDSVSTIIDLETDAGSHANASPWKPAVTAASQLFGFARSGAPLPSAGADAAAGVPAAVGSRQAGAQAPDQADLTGAAIVAAVFGRATAAPKAPATPLPAEPAAAPDETGFAMTASFGSSRSPLAALLTRAANTTSRNNSATAATTDADETEAAAEGLPATGISSAAELIASTLAGLGTSAAPHPAVEKKSAAPTSERSFLQENAGSGTTPDATSTMLQAALAGASDVSSNQTVPTTSGTSSKAENGLSAVSLAAAGMTNGKKTEDMNSTLEMPGMITSLGTNPLVMRTPADMHIQLGTNGDFHHALDQVMHVAELSNLSRVSPPLRVAIEIQTPPGAIVNVYVSRQSDSSYRAQLSTNDPQALSWVQNQIGSLKTSTDTGSAIRWAPAQLETGATISTSSSSAGGERQLGWDRGGQQGQSGHPQQDERRAPRREAYYQESDDLDFANTFALAGRAA